MKTISQSDLLRELRDLRAVRRNRAIAREQFAAITGTAPRRLWLPRWGVALGSLAVVLVLLLPIGVDRTKRAGVESAQPDAANNRSELVPASLPPAPAEQGHEASGNANIPATPGAQAPAFQGEPWQNGNGWGPVQPSDAQSAYQRGQNTEVRPAR